jgi:choline-glycine betaine transporter
VLPGVLIYVGSRQAGDPLQVVLSAALITSLPLLFVGVAMAYSLVRSLREGE